MKTKVGFFKKKKRQTFSLINQEKREKIPIIKIRSESRDFTTNHIEIRIMRKYYEQLYDSK